MPRVQNLIDHGPSREVKCDSLAGFSHRRARVRLALKQQSYIGSDIDERVAGHGAAEPDQRGRKLQRRAFSPQRRVRCKGGAPKRGKWEKRVASPVKVFQGIGLHAAGRIGADVGGPPQLRGDCLDDLPDLTVGRL